MIEIKSYLRAPDGSFTPLEEVNTPPPDPRYIEGAIELTINGTRILDLEMWDYIDQLWAYICDMIFDLNEKGVASTYFPDQPIALSFRRSGKGRVIVAVDVQNRSTSTSEDELISALRSHCIFFFEKMEHLLPGNDDSYADLLGRLAK